MQTSPAKTLAVVMGLFFFTSNLTGSFLPIYFREQGTRTSPDIEILLFTLLAIGVRTTDGLLWWYFVRVGAKWRPIFQSFITWRIMNNEQDDLLWKQLKPQEMP